MCSTCTLHPLALADNAARVYEYVKEAEHPVPTSELKRLFGEIDAVGALATLAQLRPFPLRATRAGWIVNTDARVE